MFRLLHICTVASIMRSFAAQLYCSVCSQRAYRDQAAKLVDSAEAFRISLDSTWKPVSKVKFARKSLEWGWHLGKNVESCTIPYAESIQIPVLLKPDRVVSTRFSVYASYITLGDPMYHARESD